LGKNQNVNSKIGFSNYVSYLKNGYIYHSDLVQNVSEDIQKKVMKMLAGNNFLLKLTCEGKLALVARVDSRAESRDGSIGRLYRKEIEDKIEKLEEPPPTRGVKAMDLPGILDGNKKTRRGGKRKRKFNEKYQMSELERFSDFVYYANCFRQQNRVLFGVEEEEVFMEGGEETEGLGMLGQKGSGLLRMGQMTTANRLKTKSNQKGTLFKFYV
jgi:U4/U6 small nuclear ribonucleoprotein PRP31